MQVREDGKAYAADVSLEELEEFMRSQAGVKPCGFCGAAGWLIPEHEGKPVITTLPTPAHHEGMNSFSIICSGCGHIELFSAQAVVTKLVG